MRGKPCSLSWIPLLAKQMLQPSVMKLKQELTAASPQLTSAYAGISTCTKMEGLHFISSSTTTSTNGR